MEAFPHPDRGISRKSLNHLRLSIAATRVRAVTILLRAGRVFLTTACRAALLDFFKPYSQLCNTKALKFPFGEVRFEHFVRNSRAKTRD